MVSVPSLTFPIGVNPLPVQFSPAFLILAHTARRDSPLPGPQDPCLAPHCQADRRQMPQEAKRRKKMLSVYNPEEACRLQKL